MKKTYLQPDTTTVIVKMSQMVLGSEKGVASGDIVGDEYNPDDETFARRRRHRDWEDEDEEDEEFAQ